MKKLSSILLFLSVFLVATPAGAYFPKWFASPVDDYAVPTRNRQTVRMTYRASAGLVVEGQQVTTKKVQPVRNVRKNVPSAMPKEWPDWIGLPSWWE